MSRQQRPPRRTSTGVSFERCGGGLLGLSEYGHSERADFHPEGRGCAVDLLGQQPLLQHHAGLADDGNCKQTIEVAMTLRVAYSCTHLVAGEVEGCQP